MEGNYIICVIYGSVFSAVDFGWSYLCVSQQLVPSN